MDVSVLSGQIKAIPNLKSGTLRFWGEWFGRPNDNCHRVIDCRSEGNSLVLEFDKAEILTINDPEAVQFGPSVFSVADATAVHWEWFYYGRPQSPENRYFYHFVREGSGIVGSTNVDWCNAPLAPSLSENAVEIL